MFFRRKKKTADNFAFNAIDGTITLDGSVVLSKEYTLDEFKSSPYYHGQDMSALVRIERLFRCGEDTFMLLVLFRNDKLLVVSVFKIQDPTDTTDSIEFRKHIHDELLYKWGVKERRYPWGTVESIYDSRLDIACVEIIFSHTDINEPTQEENSGFILFITEDGKRPNEECMQEIMSNIDAGLGHKMICAGAFWRKFEPRIILNKNSTVVLLKENEDESMNIRGFSGEENIASYRVLLDTIDWKQYDDQVAKDLWQKTEEYYNSLSEQQDTA